MIPLMSKLENALTRRITHPAKVEVGRAVLAVIATILIACAAFALHLNLASAISILLLATVLASIEWGVVQGTAVSLAAAGCLDFFFTPPLLEFTVLSRDNLIALCTFEGTALLVSRLSWKERVRSQEQAYLRRSIGKLYELSNAILLVDSRSFDVEQLGALMREFFAIDAVDLWVAPEDGPVQHPGGSTTEVSAAYEVYASGLDRDSVEGGWSHRVLRLGTTPIGAMVLKGWEVDAVLADAAGSLIAIAIERARSATKENRAEAARNTEQLRTAVLDALAHGFKTPLTSIQSASSGLLAIGQLDATQVELLEIIDQEAENLNKLTTRLLRTAALDAKEIRVRRTTFSLQPLIEKLLDEQDAETRRRIRIASHNIVSQVHGDEQLLGLAFGQMIDNAAKYSTVGTEIELAFFEKDQKIVFEVRNQGKTIRGEELSRIFERYYRGQQTGRGPTGTGLGLSIVKKIAEAHGGDAIASCRQNEISISFILPGGKRPSHG